jgi:hypothetical protein
MRYGWAAYRPFKVTVTLTAGHNTPDALEFILSHNLPRSPTAVSVDSLWEQWWQKAEQDQVRLPAEFLRNRHCYTPVRTKENQVVHIVMRQRLDDGSQPSIPDDTRLPVVTVMARPVMGLVVQNGL